MLNLKILIESSKVQIYFKCPSPWNGIFKSRFLVIFLNIFLYLVKSRVEVLAEIFPRKRQIGGKTAKTPVFRKKIITVAGVFFWKVSSNYSRLFGNFLKKKMFIFTKLPKFSNKINKYRTKNVITYRICYI